MAEEVTRRPLDVTYQEFGGEIFPTFDLNGRQWMLIADLVKTFFSHLSRPTIQARVRHSGVKQWMESPNPFDLRRLCDSGLLHHGVKMVDTRLLLWNRVDDARNVLTYRKKAPRSRISIPRVEPLPGNQSRVCHRALARLRSDFHDESPLSINSITAPNGLRPSAMRPESLVEKREKVQVVTAEVRSGPGGGKVTIFLEEGDYVPSSVSSVSEESDDSDYFQGKKVIYRQQRRKGRRKRKHVDERKEEKGETEMNKTSPPPPPPPKKLKLKKRRIRREDQDHAAMKRQYESLIASANSGSTTSSAGPEKGSVVDSKAAKNKKAKEILHRARKICSSKQPVKVEKAQKKNIKFVSNKEAGPSDHGTEKRRVVLASRLRRRRAQNLFQLNEAIPEHGVFSIGEDGKLAVTSSTCVGPVEKLDDAPELGHPLWKWRVGKLTADAPTRVVVRRVQLTSLPVPTREKKKVIKKAKRRTPFKLWK